MLDLHCHMLPGIDDGAPDLDTALSMARMAVEDGIRVSACTPHIYPGMYDNDGDGIRAALAAFQSELDRRDIPLRLVQGADVHMQPDMVAGIRAGRIATLAGSRYLLFEPPHHVAPPRFEQSLFELQVAGFVPVITHPERLTWVGDHYGVFQRLFDAGVWMQITAGSLTGRFGKAARHWGERMLDDGMVHILATDAHDLRHRPPLLAEGRDAAARRVGPADAARMVLARPRAMVDDVPPQQVAPPSVAPRAKPRTRGFLKTLLGAG